MQEILRLIGQLFIRQVLEISNNSNQKDFKVTFMRTNHSDSRFIVDRGQARPEKPPQMELKPHEIPSKNPSQPKPNNDSQK